MLGELQEKVIQVLETAQVNSYPAKIAAYNNELINPKKYVMSWPIVLVEVGESSFEAVDGIGNERRFTHTVELILITKQETSISEKRAAGAELLDWAYEALKGQIIYLDGQPVYLSRQGSTRTIPDLLYPFWAAVITLTPFTEESV